MLNRDEVRAWRGRVGMTQEQVAQKMGMTTSGYAQFERGVTASLQAVYEERLKRLMAGQDSGEGSGLAGHIAADLRNLCDLLDDPSVPEEFKALRFTNAIRIYADDIDEYRRVILEQKLRG